MITLSAFPKGQAALAAVMLATVALFPKGSNEVLLIPLTASASALLPTIALQDGNSLVARGTLTGSLVIQGGEIPIAKLASIGILAIAARGGGCGPVVGRGDA